LFKGITALFLAAALWLPALHLFFAVDVERYRSAETVAPEALAMAAHHLALWSDPALMEREVKRMRASNAEWDFMGRTYLVLAFANMALREPSQKEPLLTAMDRIIQETLSREKGGGIYYFLMDYAKDGNFREKGRSLFQDGEIALMLGARRFVSEKEEYKALMAQRTKQVFASMSKGPLLCGESYPNECWTFCNVIGLVALRMADALDGTDHRDFIGRWLQTARAKLIHDETGLLVSSFSLDGYRQDGPEGSSIWMIAHGLQVLDPEFAVDQYRRAKAELAGSFLGFGYAREWPESWKGPMDIDSGPIVPLLEISAGSSGLAILGASAFADEEYLGRLLSSLEFGGFPMKDKGRMWYAASNQVGDAVLLYALVQGPLWREVESRARNEGAPS
jgi:hypothetical protein